MALYELERVCKGPEGKMASLKAALGAGQPTSSASALLGYPAGLTQGLNPHHTKVRPPVNGLPVAPAQLMSPIGCKPFSQSSSDKAPTMVQPRLCQKAKAPKQASLALSQSGLHPQKHGILWKLSKCQAIPAQCVSPSLLPFAELLLAACKCENYKLASISMNNLAQVSGLRKELLPSNGCQRMNKRPCHGLSASQTGKSSACKMPQGTP